MSVFTAIAFATFFLENDYLFTFNEGKKNLAIYFCTFNGRSTDFYVAVGIKKKHFVEAYCIALFYFITEMMDIKEFSFFSFKLLSFDFYNSVHYYPIIDFQLYPLGGEDSAPLFYGLGGLFPSAKL